MAGLLQLKEAVERGIVSEGKYLAVAYPDHRKILWRMKRIGKDLVLWGMTTEKGLTLRDEEGYKKFFDLADKLVRKKYALPGIFTSVRACGSRSTVEIKNYTELKQEEKRLREIYCQHRDDEILAPYFLTSFCVIIDSDYANLHVFRVVGKFVNANSLHCLYGNTYRPSFTVRPEAIPNPFCYLQIDGHDGSKERPYVLLGGATPNKVELEAIYKEELAGSGKDELWHLLQEGKNLMTEESQKRWISRLEECVKNSEK